MRRRIIAIGAGLALAAAGLAAAQDATTDASRAEALQARLQRAEAFLKERALTRPRIDGPQVGREAVRSIDAAVDWPAVSRLLQETARQDIGGQTFTRAPVAGARLQGLRAASAENFQRVAAREVAIAQLPVLVPATAEVLASVQVFGQPDAYSAIADAGDGVALRISGARKKLVVPQAAPRERLRRLKSAREALPGIGAEYVITRSESSTDLSFARFGVGYVISLVCDEPEDARCAEDDFIVGLASSMALLNAERAGGE